jgi:Flp pilus assembly protein TadD
MGLVKRAQGHLDEAISAFGNASKYAPRDNSAYYNRGLVYMQ